MDPNKKFDKKYFTSGAYKDYQEILEEWVEPIAKRIYCFFEKKKGIRVLDVGCGFGNLIAELQDKYEFRVRGLELSAYAVEKALPSVKRKIKMGSILKPGFKKNSFKAVICFDVIYYFDFQDTKNVIKNLINISGEYIFFNTLYCHSKEASQKHNPDPLRFKPLSKKEYVDIFCKNGAELFKSFRAENGGEILIFKKI